jgi:hypothetical protein
LTRVPPAAEAPGLLVVLVKGFLGYLESPYSGRHTTVENHLGYYFGYLLFGHANVQCALNVPFYQLGAVPNDY